jgi:hypothetical protein
MGAPAPDPNDGSGRVNGDPGVNYDPGADIPDFGGMTPAGRAVATQISEGLADYRDLLWQLENATILADREAARKTLQTKTEGIAAIGEMAKQAAYETKTAFMGAELTSSAQEAKLGASGVRASGSPLLAAQQASDIAWGAAGEKGRQAAAGITLGGLKLGGSLQDIRAANTLLTQEYQAKMTTAARKKRALEQNAPALVAAADRGQIIDWSGKVISLGLGLL